MNKYKGFTIIELIVVIAIIAVLAAIVLVNVTQYINKGKDAAAEGNLSTMLTNGAVFYDSQASPLGTYNNWYTGTPSTSAGGFASVYNTLTATNMGYTVTANCDTSNCAATATKWCASVQLKADNTKYYCVDSSGAKILNTGTSSAKCAGGVCS